LNFAGRVPVSWTAKCRNSLCNGDAEKHARQQQASMFLIATPFMEGVPMVCLKTIKAMTTGTMTPTMIFLRVCFILYLSLLVFRRWIPG